MFCLFFAFVTPSDQNHARNHLGLVEETAPKTTPEDRPRDLVEETTPETTPLENEIGNSENEMGNELEKRFDHSDLLRSHWASL